MAHMQIIRIKTMVDKEKNRVVFVESDQDFVDVLLSFLTLPMGTITRLIRDVNSKSSSTPAIGCMDNLYKSVEDLDVKHFSTDHCKTMLLYPRRAAEAKCNSLKLKIDHSEPTEYYLYGQSSSYLYHKVCITASGALLCSECTNCSDNQTVIYLGESHTANAGIFVKGGNTRYIVTDDLQVKSGSFGACVSMLGVHEIHEWSRLEERNVDVSPKEVLSLLKRSLISKTPLTDLILSKGGESSEKVKVKIEPSVSCIMEQETTSSATAEVYVTLLVTGGGVFVKDGNSRYIVTDDLQVKSGTVGACMSILGIHGIHDWSRLEERNVDLSPKEVLSLLKHSLISKSPLTDLILLKEGESSEKLKFEPRDTCTLYLKGQETTSSTSAKVCVTLVNSKSTNKSLYAVVNDDFVDLLFSFLILPLGSIVELCGGTCSMGCVDNLYKSVESLSSQGQIVSEDCKAILVSPKLATHFRSMNQLLGVDEVENKYDINSDFLRNVSGSIYVKKMINPKLPGFYEKNGGQFIAGPATYMVTNDLVVTPLCLTTGLVFLKSKNVPISDVEERIITIGKQEAFNLLMASLFLDNALDAIMGSTDEVANPTGPTVKKEQVDGM